MPPQPSAPRLIEVSFRPPRATAVAGQTLIVVDTLRASTAITTLLAGGAAAVYPCPGLAAARRLHQALPGSHLCGEAGGLPPPGFERGNSPVEFAATDVRGWTVVQATSNGTPALALARYATQTLVGCLRNRQAVATAALAGGNPIRVVCAGERRAGAPSVEDSFTAGAIVDALIRDAGSPLELGGGARIARRLFQAYNGSARAAFYDSPHAHALRRIGFDADLTYAAEIDVEPCVPRAALDGEGRIVIQG